ncbi:MAG TPA: ribonuclease HII [Woeseiaceae bacterium]|nr:ribonuclease HII [Woeseiaceae bacterium]
MHTRTTAWYRRLAGVDEAGRGPLAGPVVAAAVMFAPGQETKGLADSKKLSAARREHLAFEIRNQALAWSVAWADRAEIDALNILEATLLAMQRAVTGLIFRPDFVAVDGNRMPNLKYHGEVIEGEAIVRGDGSVPAISAASILAKTTRDRIMHDMDSFYPGYEFRRHKGYPTALHRERLQSIGVCAEHRRSFAPVRSVL